MVQAIAAHRVSKKPKPRLRELGVYTVGVTTCKPTRKEAEEYYHHCIVERADWSAVDSILGMKNISPETVPMEEFLLQRSQYAQGMGGLPIVGDPDDPATEALRHAIYSKSQPDKVVRRLSPDTPLPANHPAAGKGLVNGKPALYVCRNMSCEAPITDPAKV